MGFLVHTSSYLNAGVVYNILFYFTDGEVCSQVFMLQPFTSKDFAIRSLPDRIADLQHLVHLYPDIPKDQAFGKYYTPLGKKLQTSAVYLNHILLYP